MAEKQTATEQVEKQPAKKAVVEKPTKEPPRKISLFEKIQAVRVGLHGANIKKSGKMGGRSDKLYLELADFINPLNALMLQNRFTAIVDFTPENATLTAYDFDSDQTFTITSPMREAKVQGCNDMQNLGAVETYQRRYLYMAMFDIAESDLLEGNIGNNGNASATEGKSGEQPELPTPEQVKQAQELGIDFNRLAAYLKCTVESISRADLADAIEAKQKALKKKTAAQQHQPEQVKGNNTEGPQE